MEKMAATKSKVALLRLLRIAFCPSLVRCACVRAGTAGEDSWESDKEIGGNEESSGSIWDILDSDD
jgi:hypothetical protein